MRSHIFNNFYSFVILFNQALSDTLINTIFRNPSDQSTIGLKEAQSGTQRAEGGPKKFI